MTPGIFLQICGSYFFLHFCLNTCLAFLKVAEERLVCILVVGFLVLDLRSSPPVVERAGEIRLLICLYSSLLKQS